MGIRRLDRYRFTSLPGWWRRFCHVAVRKVGSPSLDAVKNGIGSVSGCHVNRAVSFGVWIAGRMPTGEMVQYVIAQCLGAIAGTAGSI